MDAWFFWANIMFGIYFGLGLKSKVFCRKNNRMMEIMDSAKLGPDIVRPKIRAQNTTNTQKLIRPICPIGPQLWVIVKIVSSGICNPCKRWWCVMSWHENWQVYAKYIARSRWDGLLFNLTHPLLSLFACLNSSIIQIISSSLQRSVAYHTFFRLSAICSKRPQILLICFHRFSPLISN